LSDSVSSLSLVSPGSRKLVNFDSYVMHRSSWPQNICRLSHWTSNFPIKSRTRAMNGAGAARRDIDIIYDLLNLLGPMSGLRIQQFRNRTNED
jgi:hypothetical protein